MSPLKQAYRALGEVVFPQYTGLNINMMPVIMGDKKSIPDFAKQYFEMISNCNLKKGSTVYLTVNESKVIEGTEQRRGGKHTDRTNRIGWGGGPWGGTKEGIYLASTDGKCKIWNIRTDKVDFMGACEEPMENVPSEEMKANILYWMTDKTPHEALKSEKTARRQFFRLVSEDIRGWWEQHSTKNPLGVEPKCPILYGNKFKLNERLS